MIPLLRDEFLFFHLVQQEKLSVNSIPPLDHHLLPL